MTSDPSITNDPPQLQRDLSQKAIAGVASGIAAHLRLPVLWFRVAFVLLVFFNGLGMFLYGVLWALVPAGEREEARQPAHPISFSGHLHRLLCDSALHRADPLIAARAFMHIDRSF